MLVDLFISVVRIFVMLIQSHLHLFGPCFYLKMMCYSQGLFLNYFLILRSRAVYLFWQLFTLAYFLYRKYEANLMASLLFDPIIKVLFWTNICFNWLQIHFNTLQTTFYCSTWLHYHIGFSFFSLHFCAHKLSWEDLAFLDTFLHNVDSLKVPYCTFIQTLLVCFSSQVRMESASTLASMLDGHSLTLSQVAEYNESSKRGSFTTLSSSLGQKLMQFHTGGWDSFLHFLTLGCQ